jgi:antagonist of KipI
MTVQDLGRAHHRHEGIAGGGALDLHAARVANLLVGNAEACALLEITLGPTRLRFGDERVIASCGVDNGVSLGKPLRVQTGEELELRAPPIGCRSWLAISGGIVVPLVLGSRATDLRGRFGGCAGRALRDGDELPLGRTTTQLAFAGRSASWSAPNEWAQTASPHPILRIVRGSEWETFADEARSAFLKSAYLVSKQADRMGARLAGAGLARKKETELISEAVVPGTIQVSNNRQPILLLGDCQTIGGYPRIAHVITVDLPLAAQLRPNDHVQFEAVTVEEARALYWAREADLERFRVGLQLRSS